MVREQQPQIEQFVREHLAGQDIVQAFTGAILKNIDEDWRLRVSFEADKR